MLNYKEVQSVLWSRLPTGQNISFPIPVLNEGILYDLAFTYTCDSETHMVHTPLAVIAADCDSGQAVEHNAREFFSDVRFAPTPFETPSNYKQISREAKQLYGSVREEALAAKPGAASQRYVELVQSITQPALLPYYRALAPALFTGVE